MKRWSPTKPIRTPGAGTARLGRATASTARLARATASTARLARATASTARLGLVTASAGVALLAAACGQAGDSVTASQRVATGATTSPAVSAPPRQTTTTASRTTTQITTSPAVASTLAAPPTSGGTGEATVTTADAAQVAPSETLPTIVPTSAPEIVTTTPTAAGSGAAAGNGAGASATTSVAAPPPPPAPADAVTIAGVNCGRHDDGDWVVFRLSNSGVIASAAYGAAPVAVAGDSAVVVTFAPAVDATSGRLIATGCDYATEVVLAQNANGTVTWVIGVKGQPNLTTVAPQAVANGYAYVVKLRP